MTMAYTLWNGMLVLYDRQETAEHNIDLTDSCWRHFYGTMDCHDFDEWPIELKEVNLCLY